MKGPVAVVTTFGLGRTPAQAGMLEELTHRGIPADFVVGTSLGSINAAALATGEVDGLRPFWQWLHDEIFANPLRTVAKSLSGAQARKHEAALRKRVAALLPATFSGSLQLTATDLHTGGEVVMDSGGLIQATMASCALPGVFPPVVTDDRYLIDGGLIAGMPLHIVPEAAETVIVLDTGHSAVSPEVASGYRWWEVGALAYAHLIRGQAVNALVHAATKRPVIIISTDAGRLLDFSDPTAAMDAGRQIAAEVLDSLPSRLEKGIYGLPDGLTEFDVLRALVVS
jgi:NTE family protein